MDRTGDSIYEIRCGTFTTCEGDDPPWSFRFNSGTAVRDVEQRTVLSVPERRPECDGLVYAQAPSAADPALARRMACAICGWDAYLTSDVVVPGEPGRAAYLGEHSRSQETMRLR